ncbi:MAG: threonine ammonia-lyase [Vulcanimicrobiaceae bacterium]
MGLPLEVGAVEAAAERIAPYVVRTPVLVAASLSAMSGSAVRLKLETNQRTGSFKDRGAANRLLTLSEPERRGGVLAMSAGNHAQAVAYQASRLGIPATIVMPETTPFAKIRRTEQFGARIVLYGETLADAAVRGAELARDEGLAIVHPYDDPFVVAGQGTVGLEFLADASDLEVLIVPVGGGGLIAGSALAAKSLRPGLEVVGVQTEAFPALQRARAGLDPGIGPPRSTIAEGIAVASIGAIPGALIEAFVDDVVLVGESAIERAIHLLLEEEHLLAEGAGAAPLAALLAEPARFRGRTVGLVVCGGNIDTGMLANVIARVRLCEGRVVRVRVEIDDRPGVLADVARTIAECGANILDVVHQRLFSDVPSKRAELDVTFEARTPADVDAILAQLRAHYTVGALESRLHSVPEAATTPLDGA